MYDTIIVFDRVRENTKRMPQAAFSQIMNRSMSEVLTRSLATTACTLLPVVALLIFGGSTLKDFAFALLVGVASGAYSSIFIASPVLMHWKEREHGYQLRRQRIIAEHGHVPAYATGAGSDVDPDRRARRGGLNRLSQVNPEAGVSASEFEQMKRELGLNEGTGVKANTPPRGGRSAGSATRGDASRPGTTRRPAPAPPASTPRPSRPGTQPPGVPTEPVPENQNFEHAPDVNSDDAVLPDPQRPRKNAGSRSSRNKKHGRR
jgi:SecD/SecF fusion protein